MRGQRSRKPIGFRLWVVHIRRQIGTNPYTPMAEKEILAKLKKSREQEMFRDADYVISDMRSKYGL